MWKEPWLRKILLVIGAAAVCTSCAMLRPAPRPSVWKLDYKLLDEHGSTFSFVDGRTVPLSTYPPETLERTPILLSEHPLYGVLELGGAEAAPRVFVLDESKGRGSGYDTLSIDANLNQDLSDDPTLAETSNWSNPQPAFSPVEIPVDYAGHSQPYHIRIPSPGMTGGLHLSTAGYCEGDVKFGDKTYRVAVIDDNCNGLFNDVYTVPDSGIRQGDVYGPCDTMMIDLDGDGALGKDWYDTMELYHVGKYVSFGTECYEMSIAPDGRTVTVKATDVPCGYLTTKHDGFWAELVGDDGWLKLVDAHETKVPAGTYQFSWCRFERKDDSGVVWSIIGVGDWSHPAIEVHEGRNQKLVFGPPLIAEITAGRNGNQFSFVLHVKGQGGATFPAENFQRAGILAPAPRFEVRNEKGKVVALGSFAYVCGANGCGLGPYSWHVPRNIKGTLTVAPVVDVGPFEVKAKATTFTVD